MSRPANNDALFWNARRYVGSGGETVELKPASGTKWLYRFQTDRRWRIAQDKFTALLHAGWELGKSGVAMAWEIAPRRRGRGGRLSMYSNNWSTQQFEKGEK